MVWRIPAWSILLAALFLPLAGARADPNQQTATGAWRSADDCAKAAFKQFPDYTPESNAKREAMRLECLRNHRLPAPQAAGSGQ